MRVIFAWDPDDVDNPGQSYRFKEERLLYVLNHPGLIWIGPETEEEFRQLAVLFANKLEQSPRLLAKWASRNLIAIAETDTKPFAACRRYLLDQQRKGRGRPSNLERKWAIKAQVKKVAQQQNVDIVQASEIVAGRIGLAGSTVKGIYYEDLPSLEAEEIELIFDDDKFPETYLVRDWFPEDWLEK